MKYLLVILFFSSLPLKAQSDYTLVGTAGQQEYYVNFKSIKPYLSTYKVWVKLIPKPEYFNAYRRDLISKNGSKYKDVMYELQLVQIDCGKWTFNFKSTIYYNKNEGVIASYNFPYETMEDIVPKSIVEIVADSVCNFIDDKK
jgi:hypothetical protein